MSGATVTSIPKGWTRTPTGIGPLRPLDMEWLLLLVPRPLQHRGLRTSAGQRPRPWPGEVHPELRELNVFRLLLFSHGMWWGWRARAEAMPVTTVFS